MSSLEHLLLLATRVAGLALVVILFIHAGHAVYNLTWHPLASFPGPRLHAASRLPYTWALLRGRLLFDVAAMHRRYGPVVRVAPDEIAFASPAAWRDVMPGGSRELPKWNGAYGVPAFLPPHLQNTTDRDHHRTLRRAVAPGFSDAALRAQEGLLRRYVDLLVSRLRGLCERGDGGLKKDGQQQQAEVNLELWYRFTVFDIIGDLALGNSFGCLEGSALHPWVQGIVNGGVVIWLLTAANMYPVTAWLSNQLFRLVAMRGFEIANRFVRPLMEERVRAGTHRLDLINPIIMKKDEWNLTPDDMISHAIVFIGAGSETTAGVLSGATSFLLENPDKMARLKDEVRSAFASESDIQLEAVNRLPYLVACLDEAMRMYPQTGAPSLRITEQSTEICGLQVPPKTVVGIWTWSMNRDPNLFADPNEFRPERFMGDPRYANDDREALKPFQIGTRDCIGRGLAIMEMRLIFTRMIYNFDMAPGADSRDWVKRQRNLWAVWEKSPLNVALTPVPVKP